MAIYNVPLGNWGALNSLNGKVTDVVKIDSEINRGVLIIMINFSTPPGSTGTAARFEVQLSHNGVEWYPMMESYGDRISFPIPAGVPSYSITLTNYFSNYVRLVGVLNGSTGGVVSKITIKID